MSNLYNVIGKSVSENLLADPQDADVIVVPCEPGSGDIPAGTVVYRKESGLWAPAASENVTAENQLAVLKEDVAAGAAPESEQTAVAENGAAYRAGRFIDGAVTLKEKAQLTDANKAALRLQGIVFNRKAETTAFNNKVTGE